MTTNLIFRVEDAAPPVAERIATDLFRSVESECLRRVGQHADWWRAVWQSPEATPAEIFSAMGTNAVRFLQLSSANKSHIQSACAIVGKSPSDLGMPLECLSAPQHITIHSDGSVTV